METNVSRGKGGFQAIQVNCVGYGARLAQRYTNYRRFILKESDGVTLDKSDFRSWVSNIITEIMTTTGHLPIPSLGLVPKITANNIQFDSTAIPDFQENLQTIAGSISKMAGSTGSIWGVDPDLDFFFRKPQTKDSGFLFSNKTQSNEFSNWESSKLGIITNQIPLSFSTDVIKNGYTVIHAFGSSSDSIDLNQTQVNASFSLATAHVAIPFVPAQFNISKIAIHLRRIGEITDDFIVKILGSTSSNTPSNSDLQKRIVVSADRLMQLPTLYDYWLEIPFEKISVTPQKMYFVVLEKTGNSSQTLLPAYKTGGVALSYYDSTDGVTWTSRSGGQIPAFGLRTYPTRSINHTLINVDQYRKWGAIEKSFAMRDFQNTNTTRQVLIGLIEAISKSKRVYKSFPIKPTTERIPVGQYARIMDTKGLDTIAEIIGMDFSASADDNSALGVNRINVNVMEFK